MAHLLSQALCRLWQVAGNRQWVSFEMSRTRHVQKAKLLGSMPHGCSAFAVQRSAHGRCCVTYIS
jgi:hypothetical protein